MCGLTGIWNVERQMSVESLQSAVGAMNLAIAHRGPDNDGVWVDPKSSLGLGFRRLAILDLSVAGHQPMHSACGRYVMVFNGEVYNFQKLKLEIERSNGFPYSYRGHSDSEVVLAAFSVWGFEAVKKFKGMFAIALWDLKHQSLHLFRDRLGKKPLYYGWAEDLFVFASELKAILAIPNFQRQVNRSALASYFRFGYIGGDDSIFDGICKLAPGSMITVKSGHRLSSELLKSRYWSAIETLESSEDRSLHDLSDSQVVDRFEGVMNSAVADRLMSDVPLGAFLSGGVDSATVVALMQNQASKRIKTFSIGFSEKEYNEAPYAAAVAKHLGTEHRELVLSSSEAMAVIPEMPDIFDEPFGDSSQIPMYLVSKLARSEIKVALSGDGGDELFGGYNRYLWSQSILGILERCPTGLRPLFIAAICGPGSRCGELIAMAASKIGPKKFRLSHPLDKYRKLVQVLKNFDHSSEQSVEALYLTIVSQWGASNSIVLGETGGYVSCAEAFKESRRLANIFEKMMFIDMVTYLPGDILVKVDRASMRVGLEARAPFLDSRVFEFAASLPLRFKIRGHVSKWIVRQLLYRYVPQELIDRPKMGFGIPIDHWLRGPLRSWAENLLDRKKMDDDGFLDSAAVHQRWQEHLSGRQNWQHQLWTVLMFQSWKDRYL
jgi:asparagine synthase (glutamine-hydrolysing)